MTDEQPSPTTRMPTPDAGGGETSTWTTARPPDPGTTPPVDVPASDVIPAGPAPADPGTSVPMAAAGAAASTPLASTAATKPAAEPTWRPPVREDRGRLASVLFGIVVLAIGLWFFTEQTLGIDLPPIRWNQLWPVILIIIGGWVLLGTIRRSSR